MQHIIKKQVIELELDRRLDSFRTQESVSRRFWNSIVPMLQKTFDAVTVDDEVLTVDRLVIDIGVLTEKSLLKDDWIIELSSRLEKLISELRVRLSEWHPGGKQPFSAWYIQAVALLYSKRLSPLEYPESG